MTTFEELFQNTINAFISQGISLNEARLEVSQLIEYIFGLTRKDLMVKPTTPLPEDKLNKFNKLIIKRLDEKMPVQYIMNRAFFMGEEFYVDKNVLIPRQDTEILAEEVIKLADKNAKIIDIGTGSGCIAIILAKKLPLAEITASDISVKALEVAEYNAKKLGVNDRIRFIKSDIFKNTVPAEKFDIIVSNPPYISIEDKESLQIEVSRHEPFSALFVSDEKGVSFYKNLVKQANTRLNPKGILAVEIGFAQAEAVKKIFEENGFKNIKTIKDLSSIDRIIIGEYCNKET